MFDVCMIGGRQAVVLLCDGCGDRIIDGRLAAVVYARPGTHGESVVPKIVHKGECQYGVERDLEKLSGRPLWMELKYFIERGLASVNIGVETLVSAADDPAEAHSDPGRQ